MCDEKRINCKKSYCNRDISKKICDICKRRLCYMTSDRQCHMMCHYKTKDDIIVCTLCINDVKYKIHRRCAKCKTPRFCQKCNKKLCSPKNENEHDPCILEKSYLVKGNEMHISCYNSN